MTYNVSRQVSYATSWDKSKKSFPSIQNMCHTSSICIIRHQYVSYVINMYHTSSILYFSQTLYVLIIWHMIYSVICHIYRLILCHINSITRFIYYILCYMKLNVFILVWNIQVMQWYHWYIYIYICLCDITDIYIYICLCVWYTLQAFK